MVGGLPWWLGRCWASFENGGEAMLAWLGCGGEGSGGLVESFWGVVGGGVLVLGWCFGCWGGVWSKITAAKEKRLTQRIAARMNHTYSL